VSRASSITRDGKTWYFVVDIANGAGRRRQVRKRGFATKGEARDALTEAPGELQRVGAGNPSPLSYHGSRAARSVDTFCLR
jgi:integrase